MTAVGAAPAAAVSGLTSTTFAGYQVSKPSTHIKSVREQFVVPNITCKKSFSGVGPAVEVDSTVDRKTNTFQVIAAGVGVGCENKAPEFQSIILVGGTSFNDFVLQAGDKVSVAITMSKAKTSVSVNDTTSKQHATHKGDGVVGATAFLGASSLSISKHNVGLDPFTKIKISNAEVNGKSLKAEHAQKLTWVKKSTVLVSPGKLSGHGKNFAVTFKNSD
jgi:hypothetical protein